MIPDFDTPISRAGTSSLKREGCIDMFGTQDVIPMWVADMDFPAPEEVVKALSARAEHSIYGYTVYPESVYQSIQDWFAKRHDWEIERSLITMCPGVVPSLHACVMALSEPGDKVIIQPPVYFPFFTAVTETKRTLVESPLVFKDGEYQMDFEHLQQCAENGAKLLIFCSPHNPVGRVWRQDELEQLLEIARRYQMTIISDEIHADLIFPKQKHIPTASLTDDVPIITAVSPSKSFNIPGLGLSALVTDTVQHRKAVEKVFDSWHVYNTNPFSICAFEAAYTYGEEWLDALMDYIKDTRDTVSKYLQQELPEIKLINSQGTYLLWLDCHGLGMTDEELQIFFVEQAKVGLNPGTMFGKTQGSGFMRMNIATPRSTVLQALANIKQALRSK